MTYDIQSRGAAKISSIKILQLFKPLIFIP